MASTGKRYCYVIKEQHNELDYISTKTLKAKLDEMVFLKSNCIKWYFLNLTVFYHNKMVLLKPNCFYHNKMVLLKPL